MNDSLKNSKLNHDFHIIKHQTQCFSLNILNFNQMIGYLERGDYMVILYEKEWFHSKILCKFGLCFIDFYHHREYIK